MIDTFVSIVNIGSVSLEIPFLPDIPYSSYSLTVPKIFARKGAFIHLKNCMIISIKPVNNGAS
jgi:hypothetical protein